MKNAQFNWPGVSCQCITYKRTEFLEEAIESFLKQDYPGPKELIILNDDEDQTLFFDHPEIKIFNVKERFKTIGEKRNESVKLSSYDFLMPWDDDDIYLPHKISFSVKKILDNNLDYYNLNQGFYYSIQDKIIDLSVNLFHANSIYKKEVFLKVEGYPNINKGEDSEFHVLLLKNSKDILIENFKENNKFFKDTFYFYRWGGITFHLSSVENEKTALEEIKKNRSKNSPKGNIYLNPNWKEDYIKLANSFLNMN